MTSQFVSFFDQHAAYRAKLELLTDAQIKLRYQRYLIHNCIVAMLEEVVTEHGFFDLNDAAERGMSDGASVADRERSRICRYWRDAVRAVLERRLSQLNVPLANQAQIDAFVVDTLKVMPALDLTTLVEI